MQARRMWLGPAAALSMLALGFGLQQLNARLKPVDSLQDPLLDALHAKPVERQLQRLHTTRASRRLGGAEGGSHPALIEPRQSPPLDLEIRVALLSVGHNPTLSASGPWQLRSQSGKLLQQGDAGEQVNLQLLQQAGDAWLSSPTQAALLAGGQPYRGRFRLLRHPAGVQVINHLALEQYIAAVIGAEMPSSWPLEALKAQAVAARSYALAHIARPADAHWHLGDTPRWQAYGGQQHVDGRTRAAADHTAGLILSHQGGIVESLYASTRLISLEAHGHLGASMSQNGARELAAQGLRYNAILARYYPGASLARLRAGAG